VSALQPLADFAAFAVELGRRYRSSVSQTRAMQEVLIDTLHDLRAPLGSIAGYLDMLLSGTAGSLNAQQEEFVRVARDECRRVLDHVATTLGAAASHALPPLELECVDIETIVKEAVAVALPAATEHGVQLLVAAEANLPTVAADPGALLRLLTNVLDNALRYSPPGGTVRIAAKTHEASIRIHVDDEGPGWSEDALQHAFERGSLRASGGGGGLGLGLAICKAIAEAHGGTIAIANRPEGGARVTVSLPLQPKAACAPRH
jgi:two-component system sensor histidine kinase KdpD